MFLGLLSFSLLSHFYDISFVKTLEDKSLENILGCAKRFAIIARCYMFLANVRKHSARGGIYRLYYYRNRFRFLCRVSETSKSTWEAVWAERVLRMITIILQPASETGRFSWGYWPCSSRLQQPLQLPRSSSCYCFSFEIKYYSNLPPPPFCGLLFKNCSLVFSQLPHPVSLWKSHFS